MNKLKSNSHHEEYSFILQQLLPLFSGEHYKIVPALVLLALKLEGIVGYNLTKNDLNLIQTLGTSVLSSVPKKEEASIISDHFLR